MDVKLKKGIVAVFIANMINILFSLATNFLLPKYLSVDSYAAIKTFQLYVSYVGLLHLGYVDGMYLKYGGKELKRTISKELQLNISTMQIFQIVITIGGFLVSLILKDWIITLFIISIFPQNITNYYKFLYQATGEFKLYGRIVNISTIALFIVNMGLLFLVRTDSYSIYLVLYVIIYYLIWFLLESYFRKSHVFEKSVKFSWKELINNIKGGFLLTLGNLASMFLTSIDRWFVKILMQTIDFAQYSFAVSVENFLNLAISPITTTLYNFFCREKNEEKHNEILRMVIVFATCLPSLAFPVKFILEHFLIKYINSNNVIFILFSAQIFYIIIKSIYVNLYKVQKRQDIYFLKLVLILVVGFLFNIVMYKIMKTKEAFAWGTLFSAIVWFMLSKVDFKYLKINFKTQIYIYGELAVFLILGFTTKSIVGFFLYVLVTIIMIFIFMNDVFIEIIKKYKKLKR